MSEGITPEEDQEPLSLTDEQEAALTLTHNLAITAGAGTGKTTTLTERYREILEANPDTGPENILTLTFTKDATEEMREKIRNVIDDELGEAGSDEFDRWRTAKDELDDAYIHTIHAFCSRVLREFAVEAGVHPDFDTLDEGDADDVIEEAITTVLDRFGFEDGSDHQRHGDGFRSRDEDHFSASAWDWGPREELRTLTQLYSRSSLEGELASLFDERPDSVEWADRWADQSPAEYQQHCAEFIDVSIPIEEVDAIIEDGDAQSAIDELLRIAALDPDVSASDSGKALLDELSGFLEETGAHQTSGSRTDRQRFLLKVADGVTTGSGSRYSGSHYYGGAKTNWDSQGFAEERQALTDALDTLADLIEPEERNLDHDPALERNGAQQAIALARIFQVTRAEYQRLKQRRNALDYSDLITETIAFLESNETARRTLRDQLEYIMVDEVQDTDPRQWSLVKLLSGDDPDRFDGQNVFLVGDEKQSIYRFRDADVTQFRDARNTLIADNPPGVQGDLELSGNFRTVEETLTVINELFQEVLQPAAKADVEDDDDEEPEYESYEAEPQPLTAKRNEGTAVSGSVEYLLVPDDEDADAALDLDESWYTEDEFISRAEREAEAIAARLTQLFASDTEVWDHEREEYTNAQPRHVALLFRSSRRLDAFERALDEQSIAYTNLASSGFYDTPEIQPLINLLKVFEDPTATIPLYGVLRSPLFGFTDETLTSTYDPDKSLWEALTDADSDLQNARARIREWRSTVGLDGDVRIHQWSTLFSSIINETGYLIGIGADDRPQQAVANVEKFRQQLRNWEEGNAQSVTALIDRIERARDGDEDPSEATIPGEIEGVQLRTIHSAKGLEFPIVGIPELTRGFNFRSNISKGHFEQIDGAPLLGLKAPSIENVYESSKTATYLHVREHYRRRERAEQRRLLYVAATRARDHLILSGTHSIDPDTESGLPETSDWDDASSWNDWVQPTLLDQSNLIDHLGTIESVTQTIGGGTYTIRRPTPPADWSPQGADDTIPTDIEISAPDRVTERQRISASEFRDTLAETTELPSILRDHQERITLEQKIREDAALETIDSSTIGSVVHKLCELNINKSEWPSAIRRLVDDSVTLPDEVIEEITRQTEVGLAAVDRLETHNTVHSRHSEISVTLGLESARVGGDIDHLSVTDTGYIITDFKTSTVEGKGIADYTEYYLLQLVAYAGALIEADQTADRITIALAFTSAGEVRSCTLTRDDIRSLMEWADSHL